MLFPAFTSSCCGIEFELESYLTPVAIIWMSLGFLWGAPRLSHRIVVSMGGARRTISRRLCIMKSIFVRCSAISHPLGALFQDVFSPLGFAFRDWYGGVDWPGSSGLRLVPGPKFPKHKEVLALL